jgi:hypothetical protein
MSIKSFLKEYPCSFIGYEYLLIAKKLAKTDGCISAEWKNYKANHPKLYDPPKIEKASTYERCVMGKFVNIDNNIMMIIDVYDGDNFSGDPTDKKSTFIIKVKKVFPLLRDLIHFRAKNIAMEQIEQEEYDILQLRIKNKVKMLLS